MGRQENVFLNGEGNAWYHRNKGKVRPDEVLKELKALNIIPKTVIEYGCADGWRLWGIYNTFHKCHCVGIDPSRDAINAGKAKHTGLTLERGNAAMGYPGLFDVVIYGFCLYVCDPTSHFKIVAAGDANVNDGGYLIIHDFDPEGPIRVPYHHEPGMFSYKMKYSSLWLVHPYYSLVKKTSFDDGTALWVLKKQAIWPEG